MNNFSFEVDNPDIRGDKSYINYDNALIIKITSDGTYENTKAIANDEYDISDRISEVMIDGVLPGYLVAVRILLSNMYIDTMFFVKLGETGYAVRFIDDPFKSHINSIK